jgi:two-component system phosphate regulon response regulator PhoB
MAATTFQIDRQDSLSSLFSKSILIVDDELIVVKTVSAHLKRGGFSTINGLTDPNLALDAIRKHQPDMLLLDIDMPEISGLELLAQIGGREEFRNIIILMLSAAGQEAEDLSYDLGALGFIKKPAKPEDIIRIITSTFRIANKFGTR